jgi:hypothetical protein
VTVYFLKELALILHQLYNINNDLVICGDFNVNYLEDSKNRQQLDNLLATFNVHATVRFLTRIKNGTASAIDNITTDEATNYTISQISNGLSDHDAQLLTLNNFLTSKPVLNYQYTRTINKFTISQFQLQLSSENWEEIFDESDSNNVNLLFNKFLDTCLKIFQTCLQKRKVSLTQMGNQWITKGIRISCARKRELYLMTRQTNDPNIRKHYKIYCQILSNTIKLAKKIIL